jgi:hypothetical protein
LPHIDDSSSNSSDIPPALPRKSSRGPPRKISQYDNVQVSDKFSKRPFNKSIPCLTFRVLDHISRNLIDETVRIFVLIDFYFPATPFSFNIRSVKSLSILRQSLTVFEISQHTIILSGSSSLIFFQMFKILKIFFVQGRISPTLEQRPWSCLDGSNHPPPLPPKKRNIKSYMEMFGRSIIPNSKSIF